MKAFVLGAYGKVGLPAIKLLAESDLVTEIAVAGRDLERAEKAVGEIGAKGLAVRVDAADEQELVSLLSGYDVVLNAASTKVVLPAIRAATQAGVHYCDVATFGNAVQGALSLAPQAQAAGITAIVALGISPCISNLMGVHVARQLDEVEQLQIGRADLIVDFGSGRELTPRQWTADPQESLDALRAFRENIGWLLGMRQQEGVRTALAYRDGRWGEVDPIRGGVDAPHLEGGTVTAYPLVSRDSFWGMLPTDLAKASPVELYFSSLPPQLHAVLREQAVRLLEGEIDCDTALDVLYETAEGDPQRWLTLPDDYTPLPKMWVRAVGHKAGRAARCICWFTEPMWDVGGYLLTSVPLVAAALQVLRGEVRQPGVMTAEKVLDPLSFFDQVVALLPDPPPGGKLIDESFEWLE